MEVNLITFHLPDYRELDGFEAKGSLGGSLSLQTAGESAEDHFFRPFASRPFSLERRAPIVRPELPDYGSLGLRPGSRL